MTPDMAARLRGRLDGFRAAFPDFAFSTIHCNGRHRIEAVRTRGRTTLYAVITDDPDELRSILARASPEMNGASALPAGPSGQRPSNAERIKPDWLTGLCLVRDAMAAELRGADDGMQ